MSVPHIATFIRRAATVDPEQPAVTSGGTTLAYGALDEEIVRVADGLRGIGVRRGDRVAVYLDKGVEAVVALFATALAGGAFVPVNPVLRPTQVAHILRDSQATVLVTTARRYGGLAPEAADQPNLATVVIIDELGSGDPSNRLLSWRDLPHGPRLPEPIDTDLAALLYTSGSSGPPKGVALTHRNLTAGARSVSQYLRHDRTDTILAMLPLSFDAGFSQLTTTFCVGAHVVLHNYLFPRDVVSACARHRVTGLTGVPPLWAQLAGQEWGPAGESLRYFASTGGHMPGPVLAQLRAQLPTAEPFLMYGLTEAFRSTYLDPTEIDRRPGSIGKAVPNAEVLVLRPDGSECDVDEPGELVHRGAFVALGYWNDAERTAERFRPYPPNPLPAPWRVPERAVWSGDIVVRDADGFLTFVARADETIKKSGYRISPTELEEAAVRTGCCTECVAFGRTDPELGHRIVLVANTDDPDALRSALRQDLPPFMWPDEVNHVDALPRNANGKFDRAALREAFV